MRKEPIKFKDLSTPLKTTVIFMWVLISLYAMAFIAGFILSILGEI